MFALWLNTVNMTPERSNHSPKKPSPEAGKPVSVSHGQPEQQLHNGGVNKPEERPLSEQQRFPIQSDIPPWSGSFGVTLCPPLRARPPENKLPKGRARRRGPFRS
jgi:hypothetical protein